MRNPSSQYNGILYVDYNTGKISYPEGVVIKEQTELDKEMLPYAIITNYNEISDDIISSFKEYLEEEYKLRNKSLYIKMNRDKLINELLDE